MARKPLDQEIVRDILLQSRRRCCICYGLQRDISLKSGQIAHLDGKSSNNRQDNLAFLCLEHHDMFDSVTSQSKGLTIAEVKAYREELYDVIYYAWKQPIAIGDIVVDPQDTIEGRYFWDTLNASAELQLTRLDRKRVKVVGSAYWGTTRPYGPNIGLLDFESTIENNRIVYSTKLAHISEYDEIYTIEIAYREGHLHVQEEPFGRVHGMNVTFNGEYQRGREHIRKT